MASCDVVFRAWRIGAETVMSEKNEEEEVASASKAAYAFRK